MEICRRRPTAQTVLASVVSSSVWQQRPLQEDVLPLLFSCEDLKKIIILNKNHHVLKVIISNTRTFNVVSFVVLS